VLSSTLGSIDDEIGDRLQAQLVVMGDPSSTARPTIDPAALNAVRAIHGVRTVAATSFEIASVRGQSLPVGAWDDLTVARAALGLETRSGSLDNPAAGTMVASESVAKQLQLAVGDEVPIQLPRGAERRYRLAGVFSNSSLTSGLLIPWADAEHGFTSAQPMQAFVTLADGTATSAALPGVEAALKDSPEVTVQTKEEVAGTLGQSFDLVLNAVQLLLAVALLIAVLGIVNTLVLSVLERTRELGLLRAIGLRRAQTVRMIMVESVVISLFGAVLGLAVGAGLGAALVRALRDQGVTGLTMPWATMAGYLVGAAVVGVLASLLPALRAVRLNILASIAYE
jgi:putative ABC transport system permease protein